MPTAPQGPELPPPMPASGELTVNEALNSAQTRHLTERMGAAIGADRDAWERVRVTNPVHGSGLRWRVQRPVSRDARDMETRLTLEITEWDRRGVTYRAETGDGYGGQYEPRQIVLWDPGKLSWVRRCGRDNQELSLLEPDAAEELITGMGIVAETLATERARRPQRRGKFILKALRTLWGK